MNLCNFLTMRQGIAKKCMSLQFVLIKLLTRSRFKCSQLPQRKISCCNRDGSQSLFLIKNVAFIWPGIIKLRLAFKLAIDSTLLNLLCPQFFSSSKAEKNCELMLPCQCTNCTICLVRWLHRSFPQNGFFVFIFYLFCEN